MASSAARMMPTADVDEPARLELVTVRKYGLDHDWAWWRKLWFYTVFLNLIRLSFNWFRIPSPTHVDKDGRVSWCEYICIATDAETAEKFCVDPFYEHHPLPVNSPLPRASVQFSQHVYPKSKKPLRYSDRNFPVAVSNAVLSREESIQQEAHEILDRILARRARGKPV